MNTPSAEFGPNPCECLEWMWDSNRQDNIFMTGWTGGGVVFVRQPQDATSHNLFAWSTDIFTRRMSWMAVLEQLVSITTLTWAKPNSVTNIVQSTQSGPKDLNSARDQVSYSCCLTQAHTCWLLLHLQEIHNVFHLPNQVPDHNAGQIDNVLFSLRVWRQDGKQGCLSLERSMDVAHVKYCTWSNLVLQD